jgi:hypothetical protein
MENVLEAGKKPDAAQLSKALNELRSEDLLTTKNIEIIEGWIKTEFPSSIRYLARELLKGEEETEDEKEREEKIPSWDARNICSGDTQNNLIGDVMPRDLKDVVSFLLPKGGKSECIMESDLGMIIRPKGNDQVYLYDPKTKDIIRSALVYRLPSSGIWILGSPPYLRMLKSYQLESFGTHTIRAELHKAGSVWMQDHELFLAKPLHSEDFKALIVDNVKLPSSPVACSCLFKPRAEDWSAVFLSNYPTGECEWLIPTWNGFPVILGKECGKLLSWDYGKITKNLPVDSDLDLLLIASNCVNGFWNVMNARLLLYDDDNSLRFTIDKLPIFARLVINVSGVSGVINFDPFEVNTDEKRIRVIDEIKDYLLRNNVNTRDDFSFSMEIYPNLKPPSSLSAGSIMRIKSDSGWTFNYEFFVIDPAWKTIEIGNIKFVGPEEEAEEFAEPEEDVEESSAEEINPESESHDSPASFRTGTDIADWMRAILVSKQLVDYRSRHRIKIVADSANVIGMRLVLNWGEEQTVAVTPSTIEEMYEPIIRQYDERVNLRTAELRIVARNLQGAVPGSAFVMRPWQSGHITDNGVLIMNWTTSDLADESGDEGSETESEEENEEAE